MSETHFERKAWKDSKGRFVKPPKNPKRPPKGWKLTTVLVPKGGKPKKSRAEKYSEKLAPEIERIEKKLAKAKKEPIVKLKDAKTEKSHLRYRTFNLANPGEKFKKLSPKMRMGNYYQFAVYNGNKFLGYWKNSQIREYNRDLIGEIKGWENENRFATNKRIAYKFVGDTLRDAIQGISFDSVFYKARILLSLEFRAKKSDAQYLFELDRKNPTGYLKFKHLFVIECVETLGMSYDEFIREQIRKHIAAYFKSKNVRFTSGEVLQEFADMGMISDKKFQDLLDDFMVFDVYGQLFCQIVQGGI